MTDNNNKHAAGELELIVRNSRANRYLDKCIREETGRDMSLATAITCSFIVAICVAIICSKL